MRALVLAVTLTAAAAGCDDADVGTDAAVVAPPELLPHAPRTGDAFGSAVAVSGDRLAVGVPGLDAAGSDSGVVLIYDTAGAEPALVATVTPTSGDTGDRFGEALAFAPSGDLLAVGAPQADAGATLAGAVYVFEVVGDDWVEQAVIADASRGDRFGAAVAFAGDVLVIGAPGSDAAARSGGAVFRFVREGERWARAP